MSPRDVSRETRDLHALHDCQDIITKHVRQMKNEIEDKLSNVSGGPNYQSDFETELDAHVQDLLGDTFDYWVMDALHDIEDQHLMDRVRGMRAPMARFAGE